jgi:hypothetical protein
VASASRKPPACLDYVVLHELADLRAPTHSTEFFALLDRGMPRVAEDAAIVERSAVESRNRAPQPERDARQHSGSAGLRCDFRELSVGETVGAENENSRILGNPQEHWWAGQFANTEVHQRDKFPHPRKGPFVR